MPHDMDWDLNVPLEAAYHKAGLKRYRIQKTEIDQVKYTESCKEELTKSTSKVQSEKLTGMKELLGKAEVQIKIENPDSQSLKESKKVLLSAETKLNQLASTIKKDAATLKASSGIKTGCDWIAISDRRKQSTLSPHTLLASLV
eukprot:3751536-Alexandrium_andersonii.AAC.1